MVDGDTLRVRPLTRTLRRRYERLVGIDTPETNRPGTPVECGGPEATAGLTRLAEARPVRLRTDPFQDTFDRYGRLLAYAKLRGGPDLALTQLRRGWAEMYAYGDRPFRGLREPRRAERSARRAGRAVWSKMRWRLPRPASSSAGTAALLRGTHACPDLSIVVTTKASTVSTSGAPSAMGLPFSCQMPLSYIASVSARTQLQHPSASAGTGCCRRLAASRTRAVWASPRSPSFPPFRHAPGHRIHGGSTARESRSGSGSPSWHLSNVD